MNSMIQKTMDYMKTKQLGETTGHDWWHTLRVYNMAIYLSESIPEADKEVVSLAALLHDIEDWKFNDGDETAGPRAARTWLESLGGDEKLITHVETIIFDLSYKGTEKKSSMKTIEGEIVQDADRLDAIGAVGIARAFAFGANYGSEVFNPECPPRMSIDASEYKDKNAKSCTINHFYEKLFNLKNLMNTEHAIRIAEKRHDYIVNFVKQFISESGIENGIHEEYLEDIIKGL